MSLEEILSPIRDDEALVNHLLNPPYPLRLTQIDSEDSVRSKTPGSLKWKWVKAE